MSMLRSTVGSAYRTVAAVLGSALVLAMALVLPGCGSGQCGGFSAGGDAVSATCPTPTPPPLPTPKPPVIVSQGNDSLGKDVLGQVRPFATTEAGALDVTVDWTFATNDVDAFLARGDCSPQQFLVTQCQLLMTAESASAKPEKFTVPSLAAGTYTLLIGNAGPDDESVAWQVVLRPGATGSAATAVDPSAASERVHAYRKGVELQRR